MNRTEYVAPRTFEELAHILKDNTGQVTFVAGCTNVIPDLRAGALSPRYLVSLQGLEGMSGISEQKGTISIGALTTMAELAESAVIRNWAPTLASAARQMGNPLVRNRATLGGNLADASPAADSAPPLLSHEGVIHSVRGNGEKRQIPIDRFFEGPHRTALGEGEILTKVTFRKPKDPAKSAYIKLGLRSASAISVVSIALSLEMEGEICSRARVALGSVAPTPVRAYGAEKVLEGRAIDPEITESCAGIIAGEISPISDIRASEAYRRYTASVLFRRAIRAATEGENA